MHIGRTGGEIDDYHWTTVGSQSELAMRVPKAYCTHPPVGRNGCSMAQRRKDRKIDTKRGARVRWVPIVSQ